jgi:Tol biopolymer transport system component
MTHTRRRGALAALFTVLLGLVAAPGGAGAAGDLIAFTSYDRPATGGAPGGSDANIWTVDPDTGAAHGLARDPAVDRQPAWSPDGGRIAFSSARAGDFDIWTVPGVGGPPTQVTAGPGDDERPQWSRDGARVAFIRVRGSVARVWTVSAGGTGARPIAGPFPCCIDRVRWSPDGRRLAFGTRDVSGAGDDAVWIVRRDGHGLRRVGAGEWPAWSPDGRLLAYGGRGFVAGGALTVARTTGAPRPRAVTTIDGGMPAWTPDGRHLVYVHNTGGDAESRLRRVSLDGTGDVPLTPGPGWSPAGPGDLWPDVSPDGRRVAFVSGSTEPFGDIALVSLGGMDQRLLAPDGLDDTDATWRPRPPARRRR